MQLGKNSVPVGFEDIVQMYPLDFEEFLWANGISEDVILFLKDCLSNEKPVPVGIHLTMNNLLNRYVAVGGLPAAVNKLLDMLTMTTNPTYEGASIPLPNSLPKTIKSFNTISSKKMVVRKIMPDHFNGWKMLE